MNWHFFSISHSIYLFNLWANTSLNFCYIKARRKHVMKIYGLLMPRITFWSPCTWRPLLWFMSDFPSQTAFWILNHFSSTCRALHCFSPPSPSCLCLPCFTSRSSCLCLDIPSTKLKNCWANFLKFVKCARRGRRDWAEKINYKSIFAISCRDELLVRKKRLSSEFTSRDRNSGWK